MNLLSSTDIAIYRALVSETLYSEKRTGRFGEYVALSDERGLIEVHETTEAAEDRVEVIRRRLPVRR